MTTLKDMKIGVRLRIGLGAILVFVALLGALSWFAAQSLWEQTKGLHDHPLQVGRATGDLKADILAIHRGMKDLVLSKTDQERLSILQSMDKHEADAHRRFDTLYDRFSGPKKDVDEVRNAFVQWKAVRDDTIRLLREGKAAEAADRTKATGVGGRHADLIFNELNDISDFAVGRGDEFFRAAQKHKDDLLLRLALAIAAACALCLAVGYFLLKAVKDPLNELTSATDQYGKGDLAARCAYVAANEFGALSASFNALADAIRTEMTCREKVGRLADVMLREEEMRPFCKELLKTFTEHTDSQIGAVYLLNDRKTSFELFESIGLRADAPRSFSAQGCEGEFGAALAVRAIRRVRNIPDDTRFIFSTVSGDLRPKEIMTIPVLSGSGGEVTAMISLASVRPYDETALRVAHDVWSVLTARLNGVLAFRQIRLFSERLAHQNRELEAQKSELSVQADELGEQNMELEIQKSRLEEANRLKTSFISNMSHELRTPLNSVIALSGVLSRRLVGLIPEEEHGYLEVIERNGRHLLALINDILDLARIEAGREDVTLDRISIKRIIDEILETLEPQAREKHLALINLVGDEPMRIISDRDKVLHILQNIVANAVKFTDVGQVEISSVQSEHDMRISVTDTGIGIHEDRLAYIFDEFRQADESTSKRYGGTGLGLSIAKKYAVLLGGRIEVESTPGKGSTFTLILPGAMDAAGLAEDTEEAGEYEAPAGAIPPSPTPVGHGRRILVVEDSEPAVIQMKDILDEHGYHVLVAANGREALEQIKEDPPDAVILDLMMPEVDGFEVLARIREMDKTKGLPVLVLTAKHVTKEELSFLKGNHLHQLIQKGAVGRAELLASVAAMFTPRPVKQGAPRRTPVRGRPQGKTLILVVEDNPDNMLTARALLQDHYRVIEAEDGKAAIAQAVAHKPDLVLMDISLPVMDGILALKAIREEEALRNVPVIALTASAMKGNREQILAHGFDGYISKPIDAQTFLETIQETLHGGK